MSARVGLVAIALAVTPLSAPASATAPVSAQDTAPSPRPAPAFACNQDSTLTLLGLDSVSGRALFAAPPARPQEPPWVIELDTGRSAESGGLHAVYRPATADRRPFAGSIGPGPVFAIVRCGPDCLQPVRYEAGTWTPLGSTIAADGATVHSTYDRAGTPWVVLHRSADGPPGSVEASAFRLGEGDEWEPRGSLVVSGAGTVAAVPDPDVDDSIVSGSGRFSTSAPPSRWIANLPKLPPDRRGELVPFGGGSAVLVDTSYTVYSTDDAGESWQRVQWTPWGRPKARLWEPGRDFWVDLPASDRTGPPALAWFDRRKRDAHRLILTSWQPRVGWTTVASLPPQTRTLDGAVLAFDYLLRPRPGTWVLLSGCVLTAAGPGLGVRTVQGLDASSPSFLPLLPAEPQR